MIETTQCINGKDFQTKIITHEGYKRIVKFRHSDQKQVKDEIKYFGNHDKNCHCITGWSYFKKGILGSHTNHYLKNWRSLCGMYVVNENEYKFMHFVDKSELRVRKICKKCVKWEERNKEKERLGLE